MHECAPVLCTSWCGAIHVVKKTNEEGRFFLSAKLLLLLKISFVLFRCSM